MVTYEDIINNQEIRTIIEIGDKNLEVLGITEHSYVHTGRVANVAGNILADLGYDERTVELAKIAGYMHDIGNSANRIDHAQTGAMMAYNILGRIGMDCRELIEIIAAIGNHDEHTGTAVNEISAAIILADKTDVRRSRVRNSEYVKFDIHDRVNYASECSETKVLDGKRIQLNLKIDTEICPILEYFEIFLSRMLMCRRAADFLNAKFELVINGTKLI